MNSLKSFAKRLRDAPKDTFRDIDLAWDVYQSFTAELDLPKNPHSPVRQVVDMTYHLHQPSRALFGCPYRCLDRPVQRLILLRALLTENFELFEEHRKLPKDQFYPLAEYVSRHVESAEDLELLIASIIADGFGTRSDITNLPCFRALSDEQKESLLSMWTCGLTFSLHRLVLGESTAANITALKEFQSSPVTGRLFLIQQVLAGWVRDIVPGDILEIISLLDSFICKSPCRSSGQVFQDFLKIIHDCTPYKIYRDFRPENSSGAILRLYILCLAKNKYKATCINRALDSLSPDDRETLSRAMSLEKQNADDGPYVEWRGASATMQNLFCQGVSLDQLRPMLEAFFKLVVRSYRDIEGDPLLVGKRLVEKDLHFVHSTVNKGGGYMAIIDRIEKLSVSSPNPENHEQTQDDRHTRPEISASSQTSPLQCFLDQIKPRVDKELYQDLEKDLTALPTRDESEDQLQTLKRVVSNLREQGVTIYNFQHRPSLPTIGLAFTSYATRHCQSNHVGSPSFLAGPPVLSGIADTLQHLYHCATSATSATSPSATSAAAQASNDTWTFRRVKHFKIWDTVPLTDPGIRTRFSLRLRPAIARIRLRKFGLTPLKEQVSLMLAGIKLSVLESKVFVNVWISDAGDPEGDAGVAAYTIADAHMARDGSSLCVVRESANGTLMLARSASEGDGEGNTAAITPISYLTVHFLTAGSMLLTTDKKKEDKLYVTYFENPNVKSDAKVEDYNRGPSTMMTSINLEYEQ